MLLAEPVFGVGIGQYCLWSAQFARAGDVQVLPTGECPQQLRADCGGAWNRRAHQLSGRAGDRTLAQQSRNGRVTSSLACPFCSGLAAFILTWLGGHPLLVAGSRISVLDHAWCGGCARRVRFQSEPVGRPRRCCCGSTPGLDPVPRRCEICTARLSRVHATGCRRNS